MLNIGSFALVDKCTTSFSWFCVPAAGMDVLFVIYFRSYFVDAVTLSILLLFAIDVNCLKLPDHRRDKYMLAVQNAIRTAKIQVGNQVPVATIFYSVFNIAARLLGSDKLLIATIRDSDLLHRLCHKIVEGEIRYAEALAEAGAGLIGVGDAMPSPTCILPLIYRSLALPYLTEVIQVQGIRRTESIPCITLRRGVSPDRRSKQPVCRHG